jgi:molecular chaperone DnaK
LKSAAKGSDTKALQRQMDEFNESLQKIGQHIYQQAGGPAEGAPQDGSPPVEGAEKPAGAKKTEDDVVDADYREVN